MIGYYDIHCHMLPDVDDGSKDMDMTRRMLEIAYCEGIREIVMTPHYMIEQDNRPVEMLLEIVNQVREEATKISDDIHIYLGNELYYTMGIVDRLVEGSALTLNESRYALVEFSIRESYKTIYRACKEFTDKGYSPVIAHVERYGCLYKKIDCIEELVDAGAYIQVNINSLLGGITDGVANYCKKLLKYDLIHLLGTDAHRDVGRSPVMYKGIEYIEKKYGSGTVRELLVSNPQKILANKIL